MTVLIVDDQEDNRDIYAQHLRFAGCEVVEARDGSDGLFKAVTRPPDVVVMDLWMPGLDGFDAIRSLRAHPATMHLPIVVLSADVYPESRLRAAQAGADAFCAKPCAPAELTAVVSRLAKRPALLA